MSEPAARRIERLERLLEVTTSLAEEADSARLMERILDEGVAIVRAERGFVVACFGQGERMAFRVVAARNLEKAAVERPEFEFSRTIVRRVAQASASQLVTDAAEDPVTKDVTSISVRDVRSILCVPLRAEGRTLGVLYLDHRFARRELTRADLDAVETFARPAAVVLAAAQRAEEIGRQREELASRVAIIERLRAELKEQYIERSREVNALREQQARVAAEPGEPLAGVVARSSAMKAVLDLARKVAPSDASVLITGESGTGKEVIARALHALSPRAKGPFRAESCAALADPLLESELFGHERGAFTGAAETRPGIFEAAHGGTILLDEVGDMSPGLQAKVLRVLQERTLRRLGGDALVPVDVRVIGATHHDLEALVAEGRFRADLYYRLNVVRIEVPPLRERLACVPALIDHFLAALREQRVTLEPQAREHLVAYPWPGNVRELQNEIHRLVVLAGKNGTVRPGLLSPAILAHAGQAPREGKSGPAPAQPLLPGVWRLEDVEREAIARALAQCGGNKTTAAKLLGIPKTTLYHRLEKLGAPEETVSRRPPPDGSGASRPAGVRPKT